MPAPDSPQSPSVARRVPARRAPSAAPGPFG